MFVEVIHRIGVFNVDLSKFISESSQILPLSNFPLDLTHVDRPGMSEVMELEQEQICLII